MFCSFERMVTSRERLHAQASARNEGGEEEEEEEEEEEGVEEE